MIPRNSGTSRMTNARLTNDLRGIEVASAGAHNRGMETTGAINAAIYCSCLLAGVSFARQEVPARPGVTIRLLNPAGVPAKTLLKAERVAADILAGAGVGITWVECPCVPELGPHDFWLHLLKDRPQRMDRDATGFTVLMPKRYQAVSYAGVVWPAVEEAAAGLESEVSDMLGATVAHEIGHLLLGSKAHSRSGIMRSSFQRAEMRMAASGELRFTPEQARRMRAAIMLKGMSQGY